MSIKLPNEKDDEKVVYATDAEVRKAFEEASEELKDEFKRIADEIQAHADADPRMQQMTRELEQCKTLQERLEVFDKYGGSVHYLE